MAEAFAIATGVITVLDASDKIRKLVTNIIALRDADKAIADVRKTRKIARQLINQINNQLETVGNRSASDILAAATRTLQTKLDKLDTILSLVCKDPDTVGRSQVNKWQWLHKRSRVERLLRKVQMDVLQLGPLMLATMPFTTRDVGNYIIESGPSSADKAKSSTKHDERTSSLGEITWTPFSLTYRADNIAVSESFEHQINPTNSLICFICILVAFSRASPYFGREQAVLWCFKLLLPSWICARAIVGSMIYDRRYGLSLRHLRFPCYRPTTDRIFEIVSRGDLRAIELAFNIGQASPWDVDIDGNSLLWYSLSAFNENTEAVCRFLLERGVEPLFEDRKSRGRLSATFKYAWFMIGSSEAVDLRRAQRLHLYFSTPGSDGDLDIDTCPHASPMIDLRSPCECRRRKQLVLTYKRQNGRWHQRPRHWIEYFGAEIAPHTIHTYLTEAAIHHNPLAMKALLSGGILLRPRHTLNDQNEYGLTALHFAIFWSHAECLEPLLRAGIDCSVYTYKGHNILHLVAAYGTQRVLEILSTFGKLQNISKLPTPRVDIGYLNELRRTLGATKVDAQWFQDWEHLLRKCGEQEDLTWKSAMPEVDDRPLSEYDEMFAEDPGLYRARAVSFSETDPIIIP